MSASRRPTRHARPVEEPWHEPARTILKGKGQYYLLVSETEAQAIAGGVVCARTKAQAQRLLRGIAGDL